MTYTRQQIRVELYNQVPGLGFASVLTAVTNATVTDAYTFGDSTSGPNHYRGNYLYRPTAAAGDVIRKIVSNTTGGVITTGGASYSDSGAPSTTAYEVMGLLHPDELNACITRASRYCYYDIHVPVSLTTPFDGDMEATGVINYTGTNCTPTKSTLYVYSGTQSLHHVNSAPTGFILSGTYDVVPGEALFITAACKVVSGTAHLSLHNARTNLGITSDYVETSNLSWQQLWIYTNVPSNCSSLRFLLEGLESTADIYWGHVMLYRMNQTNFFLPGYVNEQYKLNKVREMRFKTPLTVNVNAVGSSGVFDATSGIPEDWHTPQAWDLEPYNLDANPYKLQLMKPQPRNELWIQARRPYADTEGLAAETDTTHIPINLLVAYSKQELGKVLSKRYPNDKRWKDLLADATTEVMAESTARPEPPLQFQRREYSGRI